MVVLTKGLGHERHKLFFTKMTFFTMQQTKHLIKKAKGPSR
jgi:hypothetical protein